MVKEALMRAGQERFRPIVLTSLTTFIGLAPILLETSMQARFLIPMIASLAFGVLFATVVTLVFVPCLYLSGANLNARWEKRCCSQLPDSNAERRRLKIHGLLAIEHSGPNSKQWAWW